LAQAAGVVIADTVQEFDDLLATFARLRGRAPTGRRLAAVTNAGFECVAIGDNLGSLELVDFEGRTADRIAQVLARQRIDGVVDLHDPLDLTPIAGAAAYEDIVRAILDDDGIDLALVGVVPLTDELETLVADASHDEDVGAPDGIVARLVRLWATSDKPWVVVVDAGPLYDPLCRLLEDGGLPTFRTVDVAVRTLGRWYTAARVRRETS
jgi:acyl-CoA synthetase (NDP forming)